MRSSPQGYRRTARRHRLLSSHFLVRMDVKRRSHRVKGWADGTSAAGGGAHCVERRRAARPYFQREGALLDQDLDAVDDGGSSGFGAAQQRGLLAAVDHVDHCLLRGKAARRQGKLGKGILTAETDGG